MSHCPRSSDYDTLRATKHPRQQYIRRIIPKRSVMAPHWLEIKTSKHCKSRVLFRRKGMLETSRVLKSRKSPNTSQTVCFVGTFLTYSSSVTRIRLLEDEDQCTARFTNSCGDGNPPGRDYQTLLAAMSVAKGRVYLLPDT